jgi:RES domain-containing protein
MMGFRRDGRSAANRAEDALLATQAHGEIVVYRIVEAERADTAFTGEDSLENGGRWSEPGVPVVYTSGSLPLAVLEALVHRAGNTHGTRFVCIPARIPEIVSLTRGQRLPREWNARPPKETSQLYGARWLRARRHAVLAVPSAVVPSEHNFLLDPTHPDFAAIAVGRPVPFRFDPRLLGGM